jgi:hypothetical protein
MKKLILIFTVGIVVLSSCQKLKDPGATAAVNMANEWWVTLNLDGQDLYGTHVKIATYNTSANNNEIWVDDFDGNVWDFKVKAQADFSNLTFSANESVSVIPGYEIKVNITDGKIFPGMGLSKSGNVVDSIHMKIEFEDDPGTIYEIQGHARTRFVEDDY